MNHAQRSPSTSAKIDSIHELEFEDRIDRMTQARFCSTPPMLNTPSREVGGQVLEPITESHLQVDELEA
jgi:hypothetical protein